MGVCGDGGTGLVRRRAADGWIRAPGEAGKGYAGGEWVCVARNAELGADASGTETRSGWVRGSPDPSAACGGARALGRCEPHN